MGAKFKQRYERSTNFTCSLVLEDVDKWNEWLNIDVDFNKYFQKLFMNVVFATHRYLIKTTPVDSGRLRGGWTALLDKYGIDYGVDMIDTSLIDTKSTIMDAEKVALGKFECSLREDPLDIEIINNVPYGDYVENGTRKMSGRYFTLRAIYKAEMMLGNSFDIWFQMNSAAGRIVEPPAVAEGA